MCWSAAPTLAVAVAGLAGVFAGWWFLADLVLDRLPLPVLPARASWSSADGGDEAGARADFGESLG
jgi:hypothetical protein